MLEPIRVLLNGRASARLGAETIPVRELLTDAVRKFFKARLPQIDPEKDLRILYEVQTGHHVTTGGISGDGAANDARVHFRFYPRTLADLPETHRIESNDTSAAVGFAPLTPLEKFVLHVEQTLNGVEKKKDWPWLGSDIKIMAVRNEVRVSVIVAVPILSRHTKTPVDYSSRLDLVRESIVNWFLLLMPGHTLEELVLNSADDLSERKLYLSLTGTSLEKGDESAVGRGNKTRGIISSLRPFTGEAIAGKNPRANMAKLYSAAACDITENLNVEHGISSDILLVNRMGHPMSEPWFAAVQTTAVVDHQVIVEQIQRVLSDIPAITEKLLRGQYQLF